MGAIRRDVVAEAFFRVPRHAFAPEASLEEAYDPGPAGGLEVLAELGDGTQMRHARGPGS
jgi:protein-L-isoaspartate O-methyltransferase